MQNKKGTQVSSHIFSLKHILWRIITDISMLSMWFSLHVPKLTMLYAHISFPLFLSVCCSSQNFKVLKDSTGACQTISYMLNTNHLLLSPPLGRLNVLFQIRTDLIFNPERKK